MTARPATIIDYGPSFLDPEAVNQPRLVSEQVKKATKPLHQDKGEIRYPVATGKRFRYAHRFIRFGFQS
jgi:CHASE1-domain containing sensor protein